VSPPRDVSPLARQVAAARRRVKAAEQLADESGSCIDALRTGNARLEWTGSHACAHVRAFVGRCPRARAAARHKTDDSPR